MRSLHNQDCEASTGSTFSGQRSVTVIGREGDIISASYGSQSSKSETRTESSQSQGSTLTAGRNLTVTATGKNGTAQSGDISPTGSQLKAGGDLGLNASRDILLQGGAAHGEIGSQAVDIARTQGEIIATREANEKMSGVTQTDRDRALAELKAKDPTKQYSADDVSKQVYSNFYNQAFADSGFGTGGKVQRAISAVTAAVQGLSGGNLAQAISGAASPYLAEEIHKRTTDANGKVNTEANLMAHAVLGAVTSYASCNLKLIGAPDSVSDKV